MGFLDKRVLAAFLAEAGVSPHDALPILLEHTTRHHRATTLWAIRREFHPVRIWAGRGGTQIVYAWCARCEQRVDGGREVPITVSWPVVPTHEMRRGLHTRVGLYVPSVIWVILHWTCLRPDEQAFVALLPRGEHHPTGGTPEHRFVVSWGL